MKRFAFIVALLTSLSAEAADLGDEIRKEIANLEVNWNACINKKDQELDICQREAGLAGAKHVGRQLKLYIGLTENRTNAKVLSAKIIDVKDLMLKYAIDHCGYEANLPENGQSPSFGQLVRCTYRVSLDWTLMGADLFGLGKLRLPKSKSDLEEKLSLNETVYEECLARDGAASAARLKCAQKASEYAGIFLAQYLEGFTTGLSQTRAGPKVVPLLSQAQKTWEPYRAAMCDWASEIRVNDASENLEAEFHRLDCMMKVTHARIRDFMRMSRAEGEVSYRVPKP